MNLTPHFSLEEFTFSETAARRGLDNSLPPQLHEDAVRTCEMLERIRDRLSALHGAPVPIVVTSGYRSHPVNAAVGGVASSDHVRAMAADFRAPAFGTPLEVARALAPHVAELGIGQLIHEFGSWVHVSTRTPDSAVNRVITISRRGTEPGIQEAA